MAFDQTRQNRSQDDYWTESPDTGQDPVGPSPYDTVAGYYQNYLGRSGGADEINSWISGTGGNLDAIRQGIQNSEEAKKRAAPPPSGPAPNAQTGDANRQRVLDALKSVNSTDDPEYWLRVIGNDPNGYGSAWDYWLDRIRRGDGSELVRNGSLQKFQDGGGSAGGGSSSSGPAPFVDFSQYFQPNRIPGGILQDAPGFSKDLVDQLTARAKQSLNIDPKTDPIIRPQVDTANATMQRQRRSYLNDLAESSNPYQTGAQNTAATQTAEAVGQNTASLESQLVQNELNARRQEIQSALEQEGNLLTTDQYLSLQRELNAVNAGLQQQAQAQNYNLGLGNLNLGWGNLGLGYGQLQSNNDQFAANYNLNATDRANYWDWLRRGGH